MNSFYRARKKMFILFWLGLLFFLYLISNRFVQNQMNPNANPITHSINGNYEITLDRNISHAYLVDGFINQYPVTFIVDTGATYVSIPASIAQIIGLVPLAEEFSITANGQVRVYETRIATLAIGEIILHDIRAVINPGMTDQEVLLGMSALKQLEFSYRAGQLVLRQPSALPH